jgi:O-antigen ligase
MLHYYGFFILLSFLFKKEDDWRNLFKFSLIAAGVMIIYGLFGNFGAQGFIGPYSGGTMSAGFWQTLTSGRFQGSLGNPAYVAPYLIFAVFFAAYLLIARDGTQKIKSKVRIYCYAALIVVFLFFFILSQTRGAFIGLGAGVLALLVYLAFSPSATLKKWSLVVLAILIVCGGAAFLLRNASFVQKSPEGRLLQLSFSDTTAQTRFWVWGSAWKGFLERPILGWGSENFTAVYDKYFNPRFFTPGVQGETWFDRAHSVFFDYLSETGILGLLAYVGMFAAFYYEFFRRRGNAVPQNGSKDAKSIAHSLERGLMFAVPIAYLVQGIAIFDVLPMYLCLFVFLAFAHYYFSVNNKQMGHESR